MKFSATTCKQLTKVLIDWYHHHKRDLPWRHTRNPYHILVSEVMLQQTRVTTVIPYYEKFLSHFPTLESLASAPEQSLLRIWSGLGYYRRVRYLQAAARQIISKWNSQFPKEYHDLQTLPGFGEYTAAAVSSIAFGHKHAAVDGNVLRVLTRLVNEKGNVKKTAIRRKLNFAAQSLVSSVGPRSAGTWNQALMELGATVCTPQNPSCNLCPLKQWCSSVKAGTQCIRPVKVRPHKKEKMVTSVIVCTKNEQFLMRQRPEKSKIMPGFWELPEVEGQLLCETDLHEWGMKQLRRLSSFSHGITSRIYDVNVYIAASKGKPLRSFHWVPQGKLSTIPLTTITRKTLAILESISPEGR